MKAKTMLLLTLSNLVLLINVPRNVEAIITSPCGIITEISEHGEPLKENMESNLLEVYRDKKRIKAKIGMEIRKNDRIQAKNPHVTLSIKWYLENRDRENKSASFFSPTEGTPIHFIIEDCPEKTILNCIADILNIIKGSKPFKIKTPTAAAWSPGTNFAMKTSGKGLVTEVLVTEGKIYLENEHGYVTVESFEEGISIKGLRPKKEKIGKEDIEKKLVWAFERKNLPLLYAQEFKDFWLVKEAGVTRDEILIGMTTSLSGRYAVLGRKINKIGAMTYFKHINEQGGIHGRKIKIRIMDDQCNPAFAVANAEQLILKEKVFCLFSPFGTAITRELMPIVRKYKVPLFGPITLSPKVVQPFSPYMFTLYPDYHTQAEQIVSYLTSINKRKITIAYTQNPYGNDGLNGTKAALKKKGLKLLEAVPIMPQDPGIDLSEQITLLRKLNPDAVILFTLPIQAANFLIQSRSWRPMFIGPTRIATRKLIENAGKAAEGAIALSITPDPETSTRQGVVKYRELLEKYSPGEYPSEPTLLGYTSAKVFVEGLQKPGRTLTRELFIKSLETMKGFKTGIIHPVTFSQKSHLGTRRLYFNKVIKHKFIEFEVPGGDR